MWRYCPQDRSLESLLAALLLEKYDLRLVSSTKDILREQHPPAANTAVLVGAPHFDLAEAKQREIVQSLQRKKPCGAQPVSLASGAGMRSGELPLLPPLDEDTPASLPHGAK